MLRFKGLSLCQRGLTVLLSSEKILLRDEATRRMRGFNCLSDRYCISYLQELKLLSLAIVQYALKFPYFNVKF